MADQRFDTDDEDSITIRQAIKFMDALTKNARASYIRRQKHWNREVPFDDSIIANNPVFIEPLLSVASDNGLDLGERWMSEVYAKLTLLRRQILQLRYDDGLTYKEISVKLGYPIKYIYSQEYYAIKKFRDRSLKGENPDGQK